MISEEGLKEFKEIILEEYGIELSDLKAYEDAMALLEIIKMLISDGSIQNSMIDKG